MANPWFRLYSEFADDPKVQMMPEAMQRRLVMLMCSQCKGEKFHETLQAFHWRIAADEIDKTKQVFLSNGFIDEKWNLLNWNKRQFLSDSSTERVRLHRAMKRVEQNETKKPVSPPVSPSGPYQHKQRSETACNVTVTAPDTDTDTETEQKQKTPRAKRAVDPRHTPCREALEEYWKQKNPRLGKLPWSGRDAKALSEVLAASPDLSLEQFTTLLQGRANSSVAHGDRVYLWIAKVHSYTEPLNQFNKPGGSNGHGHGLENKAEQRQQQQRDAITRAVKSGPITLSEILGQDKGLLPGPDKS